MCRETIKIILFLIVCLMLTGTGFTTIYSQTVLDPEPKNEASPKIKVGAERLELYLHYLQNKTVAIVANQTSMIGKTHLVDSLKSLGINIKLVFAPEHGFRGIADAGEHISNYVDEITGLPIVSLYGDHYKPTSGDLSGIDIVVFDIQDVGVRYYTYLSTMHYIMEACAENNVQFLVLDRPNPNGFYVDGPVLKTKFASFVGLHPVPLVYGMTLAEYAKMINNEGWLKDSVRCNLTYVLCQGYDHNFYYRLPIKPSPNLPNMRAIYLYPSLGLFEGTNVSVGRGTDTPFQVLGQPNFKIRLFSFKPQSIEGAKYPLYKNKMCYGFDLTTISEEILRKDPKVDLHWLITFYTNTKNKRNFFNPFLDNLAGSELLKNQIIKGLSDDEIRASWQKDINHFKKIRKKYLLYDDFE